MKKNKPTLSLVLIFIAIACLIPGLSLPMMSIEIAPNIPLAGNIKIYDKTQSILGTIQTLHMNDNRLVACLILLFSVIVPILKTMILLFIIKNQNPSYRARLHNFIYTIGKWSMADVFIVGVFLASLATKSDDGVHANLHIGFYFFLGYCIVSILATRTTQIKIQ